MVETFYLVHLWEVLQYQMLVVPLGDRPVLVPQAFADPYVKGVVCLLRLAIEGIVGLDNGLYLWQTVDEFGDGLRRKALL